MWVDGLVVTHTVATYWSWWREQPAHIEAGIAVPIGNVIGVLAYGALHGLQELGVDRSRAAKWATIVLDDAIIVRAARS